MFPQYGSVPQPSSFPESSSRQLSSYPQFMSSVVPWLSDHMNPQKFNALYSMVNEFDMAQRARAMEEAQLDSQHPNHTILGCLSIDSQFNAPAASGHSAARQSFDSSCSFHRRGIGNDGVRRTVNARHINLNFNDSSIQEDEEASRFTHYKDVDQSNSNDNDRDEDEGEDYLVADGDVDVDDISPVLGVLDYNFYLLFQSESIHSIGLDHKRV
ncbi:hypothetical protein PIB30_094860 [Stylosanthes scabra]|uniref:Uncharacterized protein n=1 Tax=Stylosanthes scabra TaxID=79078 RepID=A0ABU6ZUA6_9FABA|nr:hypothetical protein [Stylosanthes scabra]